MRATARSASPLRLAALWFGVQAVWGAVLGISLQARCVALAGGDSLAAYGHISVMGALAAAVVQLIAGPFSDALRRNGNRRIGFFAVGICAAAFATLCFYRVASVTELLWAFVALQASMNFAIGPYQAVIPDFVEPSRIGTASAWMAGMQSAGNAFGAILASALLWAPLLAGALAVVLVGSSIVTLLHVRSLDLRPLLRETRLVLTRALVDLFVSRALVYLGFYTLLGYLFFFVRDQLPASSHLDPRLASGLCILIFTVLGTAGAALGARPADRADERLVVNVGGGIMAISVLLLALASSPWVIPPAIAVAGIGWGIFICADWAFACRLLPGGALASTMAVWNLAIVGPQMLAPLLATALLSAMHVLSSAAGPRIAFVAAGVEILAGIAWIWRLPASQAGDKTN